MNPQDIRTLVDRLTILEAGEPTNPSRRGFLKKAAGAAAIAAAPGSLLKGIGNTAASAANGVATSIAKGIGQYITNTGGEISVNIPVNRTIGGIMVDSINMFVSEDPEDGDGYLRVNHEPTEDIPYNNNDKEFEEELRNFLKEKGFDPDAVDGISFNEGGEQEEDAASFDATGFADSIRTQLGIDNHTDYDNEVPADSKNPNIEKSTDDSSMGALGRFGIRAALTKLGNMVVSQNKNKESPPPTASVSDTPSKPLALPPPTKSEYDDLLTPQVNKEKPEFDYWKPGEENPEQLKKKKQ
jgi:hypothetical protein